jgi:hypothetical protein
MGKQCFKHLLCEVNKVRARINASWGFNMAGRVHCCPAMQKFTGIPPLSPQMTATMIFSANVTLLNFSFLENNVFYHCITYHLDSGSKWLTQFSFSKAPKILIEVHRETRKESNTYLLQ